MERKNQAFRKLLKARGLAINDLVRMTGAGRCHLSMVLNGLALDQKPGRGRYLKPKLFRILTTAEITSLGWSEEYTAWLQRERHAKIISESSCGRKKPLFHSAASTD